MSYKQIEFLAASVCRHGYCLEQLLTNASDRSVDSAAQDDLLNYVTHNIPSAFRFTETEE